MADHYETLGVASDASPDEVRSAYLRRARALHPDRQTGLSREARDRATEAMVQVNVAWSVLKDPASRRSYDRQIAARPSPSTSGPTRSAPQRPPHARPHSQRPPTQPGQVRAPGTSFPSGSDGPSVGWAIVGGAVPYVAILALGVALFVITAIVGGPSDVSTRVPASPVCVSIPPSGVPVSVPCTQDHDGRLVAEVNLARVCPAGERYEIPGGTTALCLIVP